MPHNNELEKFYIDIQEEVRSSLHSQTGEQGSHEELFTQHALTLLTEAGETENYQISYDEKLSRNRRGTEHKINAYVLHEYYETLDLFITIYKSNNEIQRIPKRELDKAFKQVTKFFQNAVNGYAQEIEEASQIFSLAQQLSSDNDIAKNLARLNVFLITNGEVESRVKFKGKIEIHQNGQLAKEYPVFFRIVDIHYLYNISENDQMPIEIDFESEGTPIPCLANLNENDDHESYLAVIPGVALKNIYERYGSRLLEQNVRSFLQFTGKINKGIRKTILEEPHMFFAFNNGIAATAEEVKIIDLPNNQGKAIAEAKNFQIVNGGQTTASIYHTYKKDKVDISQISVQLKLTIIKNRDNVAEIVGRVAEYANTQNKVSWADLTSNRENHIILEQFSRTIWAPAKSDTPIQTRWFYERSRGQYKNEKSSIGKKFEQQNPKNQMFTKEALAKYINSYREKYQEGKLVIGPHVVVRGSQKNYTQFLNYNFDTKPDEQFFKNAIALAILFKAAEKIYGIKPNAIGDMRYVTVPYSIAWLGHKLNYSLNLDKIWKNQVISDPLKNKLRTVMLKVEALIRSTASGALYGEWAKKEDCWAKVKAEALNISFQEIENDRTGDT